MQGISSEVLSFCLYVFISVQKIISWKVGTSELICLHGRSCIGYVPFCETVAWEYLSCVYSHLVQ